MDTTKVFTILFFSVILYSSITYSTSTSIVSIDSAIDNYFIETVDSNLKVSNVHKQNEDIFKDLFSIPTRFAMDIYGYLNASLPFAANPNNRLHDMSLVYALLTLVDAYYMFDDVNFLISIYKLLNEFHLDINSTFIGTPSERVYASDNLLLILMYENLASMLEQTGDTFGAETYWSLANNTLTTFIDVFYDTTTYRVANHANVDGSGLVTSVANYTSSVVTGLFSMAIYRAKDVSIYYTLAYNSIVDYITNASYYLSSGFGFFCYQSTLGSGTSTDNFIDLIGNLYLATAMLQHFWYQEHIIGDSSIANLFYDYALYLEEGLISVFRDSSTGLLVAGYNKTNTQFSSKIYTFDNVIALLQYLEYYRLRYEITYSPPDYAQLMNLYTQIRSNLIPDYNAIYAGELLDQTPISIQWDTDYLNPLIIGYAAIDAFLKLFPLRVTVYIPGMRIAREETFLDLEFLFDESTGIFGSSTVPLFIVGELEVGSTTGLNISAQETLEVVTTRINANLTNSPKFLWYNFTADVAGTYSITLSFNVQGTIAMDTKLTISFIGRLGITTDPNNIAAVEGLDEDVYFAIYIHDELGYGVSNVDVNVTVENTLTYKTDVSGYVYVSIPIKNLLPPEDNEIQTMQSNYNTTITISAMKKGYLSNTLIKLVKITRNNLVLTLSPSPPTIKEGNDLTLYVSVAPQIQANVYNPKAQFYLDGKLQTTDKGVPVISLPNTVTLKTSSLKSDAELAIYVTSSNFRAMWFNLTLTVQPLGMIEKVYKFISNLLNSTWAQVLGSLGVVWVVLWYRIRLLIGLSIRCPYCGEITKSKKPVCRNCGRIINKEKYYKIKNETLELEKEQ